MKKKVGIIASSVATIAVCASMVAGSTYALFTSEDKVDISVTAGNVSYVAEVVGGESSSTLGGSALGTFNNENGVVSINDIVPGDVFSFTVNTKNESTVLTKYRTTVAITNQLLASALKVSFGGVEAQGLVKYSTDWQELKVGEHPAALEVTVEFVNDETVDQNYLKGETTDIIITVEGVQGNYTPAAAEAPAYSVSNGKQLAGVLAGATESTEKTTVNIASDLVLDKPLDIRGCAGEIEINGNGHVIAANSELQKISSGRYDLLKLYNLAEKVTINDLTLEHGATDVDVKGAHPAYHTLDVNDCANVVLNNVTLIRDGKTENGGAPLVINNAAVVANGLHLVAGGSSWYGANVDTKAVTANSVVNPAAASLTIDGGFTYLDLEGTKPAAIFVEGAGQVNDTANRLKVTETKDEKGKDVKICEVNVAKASDNYYTSLNEALEAISTDGGTIEVLQDVALTNSLYFEGENNGASPANPVKNNIVLNGNGYTITAARNFTQYKNYGRYDLVKLDNVGHKITINDITLEHIALTQEAGSYHTLDIYQTETELNNVTVVRNVVAKKGGCAITINGAKVTASNLNVAIGGNAWGGINIDKEVASLILNDGFTFTTVYGVPAVYSDSIPNNVTDNTGKLDTCKQVNGKYVYGYKG